MLDLSRLDAGLIALDVAGHDLCEVIEEVAASFRTLAQEKGVELSVDVLASPAEVRCNRARLEMALLNLLDNALKFTPAGGRVTFSAVTTDEYPSGGEDILGQSRLPPRKGDPAAVGGKSHFLITVTDTGSGIEPEDMPRIFERFYRGRTASDEGTGLGLAIVQSITQAHGGEVFVESEMGHGSRFVIELPMA